jgi:hypothetical protein
MNKLKEVLIGAYRTVIVYLTSPTVVKMVKRALWTIFNGITACLIVYFTGLANQGLAEAGIAVIILTTISQAITKYLNRNAM